jgi:hypothetical protein
MMGAAVILTRPPYALVEKQPQFGGVNIGPLCSEEISSHAEILARE